jgi:ATP-dependent Zn protease
MELEWGMGDGGLIWHSAAPAAVNDTLDWMRPKLAHTLTAAHSQARAIIATHRPLVEKLAARLMEERELTGPTLAALVTEIKHALGRSRR